MSTTVIDSPVGPLRLTVEDGALVELHFVTEPASASAPDDPVLQEAVAQLTAYFAHERQDFDLPLAPRGTAFQQRVWAALREIPYGTTTSYGALARRLGNPAASRAVGLANGQNPIAIMVPCHRVVGADGRLVGYGGGVERKRELLDLEQMTLFAAG